MRPGGLPHIQPEHRPLPYGRPTPDEPRCVHELSKDLTGDLIPLRAERRECRSPECTTLTTLHVLVVEVASHEPCDSRLGTLFDGRLVVERLVHHYASGSGERRGVHGGEFSWYGRLCSITGELAGVTNVGTHRDPVWDGQRCDDGGILEGQLRGRVVRARVPEVVGCDVLADYRIRFDPSEDGASGSVTGTLEGAALQACGRCTTFETFAVGSHPNPWTVGGLSYDVRDATGAPTATADVVTWGAFSGLHCWYETRLTLPAPANEVTLRLVHFAAPAEVEALDATSTVVASQTMIAGGGTAETIVLTAAGIQTVVIRPPNDEVLLLELCLD